MTISYFVKSLKPTRTEHWIILSIFLYTMYCVLSDFVSPLVCKPLLFLGCIIYIVTLITKWKGVPLTGLTKGVFIILVLWTVCLTIHMFFFFDLSTVITGGQIRGTISYISYLFDSLPFFPHLLPLCICCFPKNYSFDFGYFVRMMFLVAVVYICVLPFSIHSMSGINRFLGDFDATDVSLGIRLLVPATIMIYLKKYLSSKQWGIFLFTFICGLLVNIYLGRRGASAICLLYILTMWLLYVINEGRSKKIQVFIIGIIMIACAYGIFMNTSDSLFSYILERGIDDNRSDRNIDMISDMNSNNDWLFGRGWFGQYYDTVYGYRGAIETGALALLLRGGFLYFIPYVALLLFTFINGTFRSKNVLCKALGIVAGLEIVYLYPYGWPLFSFNYFFLWIGVYMCNSARIRNLTDGNILSIYF